MAKSGLNLRDLPQLLSPENALIIKNYLITAEGGLEKRKGIEELLDTATGVAINMLVKWTDDIYVIGYGTTVATYTISTDTIANIKVNFSANTGFQGVRYGAYFFVCNGVDRIWRMDTAAFTLTEIAASPRPKVLKAIDTRLFAGNLTTNTTAVQYSEVDDGTNPPFTAWSSATTATSGGEIFYRNAGDVNVIENLGNVIIVGADDGKWAFTIDTIDSAGTLTKIDNTVMYRLDAGMKASLQTDEGVFYVNSQGLWQLVSVGQSDIAYSDQEALISEKLGDNYFNDAVFDDATLVKDDKTNQLFVSYREDSSLNNQILVYNTQLKAFATFTGLNINRFMNDEGTMFGSSSTNGKVWEFLTGNDDDGSDIWYEFEQELSVGQLWTRKELLGQYIQGELSPTTAPLVKFSIYDRSGTFIADKLELQWNFGTSGLSAKGYGESSWGDPFGGDIDFAGTAENFAGGKYRIKNFQRIRVNISGHDKAAHTVNWLSLLTREKVNIRRRNLVNVT
jgi:hypothetical protein